MLDAAALEGLLAGAARVLAPAGILVMYGPFMPSGEPVPAALGELDCRLQALEGGYGVRNIAELRELAMDHGLRFLAQEAVGAVNKLLVFVHGYGDER